MDTIDGFKKSLMQSVKLLKMLIVLLNLFKDLISYLPRAAGSHNSGFSIVCTRQAWRPKTIAMPGPVVPRLNQHGAGHGLWPYDMAGSYPARRPLPPSLPPPPFFFFFFFSPCLFFVSFLSFSSSSFPFFFTSSFS